MEVLYPLGPSLIAAVAAAAMAAYLWRRSKVAGVVLVVWAAAAIVVGQITFFPGPPTGQLTDWISFTVFGMLAFGPAAVLLIAAWRAPRVQAFIDQIPTSALVATQLYRVGGVFLIWAYLRDQLPAAIGVVTGVVDLTVAVSAGVIALLLRTGSRRAPRLVIGWAVLALLDFGWASLLLTMSFLGALTLTPAPIAMGNPPLLVISLFALPLGIFLTVCLIGRMRRDVEHRPALATVSSPAPVDFQDERRD